MHFFPRMLLKLRDWCHICLNHLKIDRVMGSRRQKKTVRVETRWLVSYVYHFSTVVDFSSEKYREVRVPLWHPHCKDGLCFVVWVVVLYRRKPNNLNYILFIRSFLKQTFFKYCLTSLRKCIFPRMLKGQS